MESQKEGTWRELLATCDRNEQKIERLIKATIFLFLYKTLTFHFKKKHAKSELTYTQTYYFAESLSWYSLLLS